MNKHVKKNELLKNCFKREFKRMKFDSFCVPAASSLKSVYFNNIQFVFLLCLKCHISFELFNYLRIFQINSNTFCHKLSCFLKQPHFLGSFDCVSRSLNIPIDNFGTRVATKSSSMCCCGYVI